MISFSTLLSVFLPLLLPQTLLPLTSAAAINTPTGALYCPEPRLIGNCAFITSTASDYRKCRPVAAGSKGSMNVYPGAICFVYEDDKCSSQTFVGLNDAKGYYWEDMSAKKGAWRSFYCTTTV